jgi:serine/threonine protein kinase
MAVTQPGPSRTLSGAVLSRRWRVAQKLGEGGMGEVYAAAPVGGGPRVAVKVLRSEFLLEPDVLVRFLEEGRTCIRLTHPNIVRVFECVQAEDGSPYIVMELLEGVPLSAYTADGGRVPAAQAVPILHGILAGLAAAHASGVVHRDLKPDNVFLTRDAEGTFVAKLLDFGVAKVMDAAGGMGNRTRTGMLLGTPAYMSPEQVRNAKDVDPRADLWSAGVMFYEMLTGRCAFDAPTEFARLTAVLTVEPEPAESVDPSLAPLSHFLARCLKKNRDERFATALDMARALGATSTRPHATVSNAPPAERGGETLGAGSGGTLASPPAGPVAFRVPQVALVDPRRSSGEVDPGSGRGVGPAVVVLLVLGALVVGFLLGWSLARMG